MLALGVMTGAGIGVWTAWQARRLREQEVKPGLIDWNRVRSIAISMNREAALTAPERIRLDGEYRTLVSRTVPLVSTYTGDALPEELTSVYAFDRVDWINANIESFRRMFAPIEGLGSQTTNKLGVAWHGLNQRVLSVEVGFMLGYLARRVLGQYDLSLLGREPLEASGKLYFVQPNIVNVERGLQVPADQFRLWLALHETTHAFEFEAHPWLRDHMNAMLEEYFGFLTQDVEYLRRGIEAVRIFWDRARTSGGHTNSWIELVMSAEQRDLFARMQAMMAVVEGYSNHVMNAVGQTLMPDYETIKRRFERRQRHRSPAEQIFARLTGLDLKLEQYRLGETFIEAVCQLRDHYFARRVWDNAESLPTMAELSNPAAWVARIEAADADSVSHAG
jgi:coenzyme F420 biosynthesis associated uncharacterized protein